MLAKNVAASRKYVKIVKYFLFLRNCNMYNKGSPLCFSPSTFGSEDTFEDLGRHLGPTCTCDLSMSRHGQAPEEFEKVDKD